MKFHSFSVCIGNHYPIPNPQFLFSQLIFIKYTLPSSLFLTGMSSKQKTNNISLPSWILYFQISLATSKHESESGLWLEI